ncbi:MAG: spore protease YyaC [Lachnospiraceae bacterium]|nr:spore protease YyaC [Lachnospiraceae bacterium]
MPRRYNKNQIFYFNSHDPYVPLEFGNVFRGLIRRYCKENQTPIFLCIGTDRATGDCLGPLLGDRLRTLSMPFPIFGTLEHPVHARNLVSTVQLIKDSYSDPFIIAVDASLGSRDHIGYITLGAGSLKPGAGVSKELPNIGHIFITGIVNQAGEADQMLLQTTRLQIVMQLTNHIFRGIQLGLANEPCLAPCKTV